MHIGHEHRSEHSIAVTLLKKETVAAGTMAFFFKKPDGFEFRAGQHTSLTLIDPSETDGEGNSRDLSIASSPSEPYIEVATRIRDTAFKRVLSRMEDGGSVRLVNAHGSFTLQQDTSKKAVFLIGGIGITPVLSIIKDATERKLPHTMVLFYSNRRPEDAPFLKDLQHLAQQNPSFTLVATMTDPEKSNEKWDGEVGLIDNAMLKRHLGEMQSAIYYLSGPPAMVGAMRTLLTGAGVNDDAIKTEEFSGY